MSNTASDRAAADNARGVSRAADADADAYAASDSVLNRMADIGLSALIDLKSPRCEFLHLTEA